MQKEIRFDEYANFIFNCEVPEIPGISNKAILDDKVDIFSGTFSVVIPSTLSTILKISKCLEIDRNDGRIRLLNNSEYDDLLVKHSDDSLQDKQVVLEKLNALQLDRFKTYEKIKKHLEMHVTTYQSFEYILSPRRLLERALLSHLKDFDFESVPIAEFALMESWENIDPSTHFTKMSFEMLEQHYKDERIKSELKSFSEKAFKTFQEEGFMIDIGGDTGIPIRTTDNQKTIYSETDDLINLLMHKSTKVLPVLRNLGVKDSVVKLFDTYPVTRVHNSVSTSIITDVISYIMNLDYERLKMFLNSDLGRNEWYRLVCYHFIMLRYLSL